MDKVELHGKFSDFCLLTDNHTFQLNKTKSWRIGGINWICLYHRSHSAV